MSVRTISIHSVREIDLEVSLAHVEQFQIEKSAAVGASGSFFLPPSLMQKLIHDPSSECEARDSGWTGRINGAAQRLMRPYLTADRRVREKKKTQLLNKKRGADFSPPRTRACKQRVQNTKRTTVSKLALE